MRSDHNAIAARAAIALTILLNVLLLLPSPGFAQAVSASLNGPVQDSTGARMSNLLVVLAANETQFRRSSLTNGEGFFAFVDLTPNTYNLSIEAKGFISYLHSGIILTASQQQGLGTIGMELGQITESVTVRASILGAAKGSRNIKLIGIRDRPC